MKKTFHKNVGNISTPEAFIDQPNISVDNEVIYKHAQASNAEQHIKSFHSSVYETAHASHLKLAEKNKERLEVGISDSEKEASEYSKKISATQEFNREEEKLRNSSLTELTLKGFCFTSGVTLSLFALWGLGQYWINNDPEMTLESIGFIHIVSILSVTIPPLIVSMMLKFGYTTIQTDRGKLTYKRVLLGVGVLAFTVWVYNFNILVVAPSLQNGSELIADVINLEATGDTTSSKDNSLMLVISQVVMEVIGSTIFLFFGQSIGKGRFNIRLVKNQEYALLSESRDMVMEGLGKLKEALGDNESYIEVVLQGKEAFERSALASFSEYRGQIEKAKKIEKKHNEELERLRVLEDNNRQDKLKSDEQNQIVIMELHRKEAERKKEFEEKQKNIELERERITRFTRDLSESLKTTTQTNYTDSQKEPLIEEKTGENHHA